MFDLNVNLELYRVFYATVLTGSMTKAAKMLYIGQPAVSKTIKMLEEQFNVTLFLRTAKGLVLTDEGRAFYKHIANAMEEIKLAEASLNAFTEKSKKTVKIEICGMQYKHLILPHIKNFFERCADEDIFDISPTTDAFTSLDLLKTGEIDCCMVTKPLTDNDFYFLKLFSYNDYLMGTPHYIESVTKGGQDLARAVVFISIMNEGIMSDYEKMRLKNLRFPNKMKVTSMDHTIPLVKLGCGIGFIAEELVQDELKSGQLIKLELPYQGHKREVGFLLNKNQAENKVLMRFIDFYQTIYNA